MKILINGKAADITLENEKTLGDVVSGIENWIFSTGSRIQRICINGKDIPVDSLKEAFTINISEIENLEFFIRFWRELAAEALGDLYETCLFYANASFDERSQISAAWRDSSAARFLCSDIPEVYNLALITLSGESIAPSDFIIIIEERLREVSDTEQEINSIEEQVQITAKRMEELPLDMQTGKDKKAAETLDIFSQLGKKLFRIFFIQKTDGLSMETLVIDDLPAKTFFEEFNSSLNELYSAYENQDTVLAGDVAEYELAPKLLKFFNSIKCITKSLSKVESGL